MRLRFVLLLLLATSAAAETVGCLYQDASGKLWLQHLRSGTTQPLAGNTNVLLHHLNQIVAVPTASASANGVSSGPLAITRLRVVAESCTSVLPSSHDERVGGKAAGIAGDEASESTTATAAENTPGFQTESGTDQRKSGSTRKPEESSASAYGPQRSEQAGESEAAADTNAAAALRAEMYPGTTLGVNDKGPPPSSVRAMKAKPQPKAPQ
jgi:hypothetical protein